jgi:uncharacterized protein (UPF0264 family)
MNEDSLRLFTSVNRDAGVMTAIAGSLCFDHLPALKRINPDIIGVRAMVCGGNRDASIREELVLELARMVG